jgi:hypothetical protein
MFEAVRSRLAFGVDAATHIRVEGALWCAFDVFDVHALPDRFIRPRYPR